ncbi:MAG: hypothetical protein ACOCW9_05880 [Thermodesulfobacteriota bacterium]
MDIRNDELDRVTILLASFYLLSFLISPILLIWSLNTLFKTGIALTLKNWLAGLVLMGIIKFLLRGKERVREMYEDYYREDEDEEEDEEDPEWDYGYDFPETDKNRRKAKLILYQNPKNNHKSPPEENS